MITERSLVKLLRDQVATCKSQKTVAAAIGISPQYLSDILAGKRELGTKVQSYFGVRRVVMYEKVKP